MMSVFLALTLAVGLCPSFAWAGEDPASTEPAGAVGEGSSLSAGFIGEGEGGSADSADAEERDEPDSVTEGERSLDAAAIDPTRELVTQNNDYDLGECGIDITPEVQSGMSYEEVVSATAGPVWIYDLLEEQELVPTEDYQLTVTGPSGEPVVTGITLDSDDWKVLYGVAPDDVAPVGIYSVVLTGKGDYEGTEKTLSFKVREGRWLSGADFAFVEVSNMPLTSGGATQPEVSVEYFGFADPARSDGQVLVLGQDYLLEFADQDGRSVEFPIMAKGRYQAIATGIGDCFGEVIGYFTVYGSRDISFADVDYRKAVKVGSSDVNPVKSVTLGGHVVNPADYTASYTVWTWDERVEGFGPETWSGSGAPDEIGRYSFSLEGNANWDDDEGYYGTWGESYYYLVVPDTYVGAVDDLDVVSLTINGEEYVARDKGDTRWDGFTQYAYTGSPAPIDVVLRKKSDGSVLEAGKDYTVSFLKDEDFNAYTDAWEIGEAVPSKIGKYYMEIRGSADQSGNGDYSGFFYIPFEIVEELPQESLDLSGAAISGLSDVIYSGITQTPSFTVTLDGKTLAAGSDYDVSYSGNVDAGTATVTVTGKGNYSGTASGTFRIAPADLSGASVAAADQAYTGQALTPAPTVMLGGKTLAAGADYDVAYSGNVDVGTATVTVTGKGNYAGTATGTFAITGASLASAKVTNVWNATYNGKAQTQKPTVTLGGKVLVVGRDYKLTYRNNVKVGTATMTVTGIGGYTGTKSATFKVTTAPMSIAKAKVTKVKKRTYTGTAQTQAPKVKLGKKALKAGRDYTITYSRNVNAGTATATVHGIGAYSGTKTFTFKIAPAKLSKAKVGVSAQKYTGKAVTPSPVVKAGGKVLRKGVDYTVSYKNNVKKGTAKLVIKGKGNYTGSKTIKFKIK